MTHGELLTPNPSDPREMEVYESVPEHDRQAWLHFLHDSQRKESLGIGPAYTFDQFENGLAPHLPGLVGIVDELAENGLREDQPLVKNFREAVEVGSGEKAVVIDPLLSAFQASKHVMERARARGPLALVLPHTSLATPYAAARSFIEAHGAEIAPKVHIVIGPRPAVIQFEAYSKREKTIKKLPPVLFGRALGNVLLTGPDTDSTRGNLELADWLKDRRKDFWGRMDEITEPASDGDNNVIFYCPAGRVAEEQSSGRIKEYRVDGSLRYLTQYRRLGVMPVGAYDRLLSHPENPESIVMVNPDIHVWRPSNDNEAQFIHERAVALSKSPVGNIEIESISAQNLRLTRQRIRKFVGKTAKIPYLVE